MKILIITDAWHPQVNGVVRTYEHLSAELQNLGHDVQVIGPHDFPRRLPMPGYKEIELALFPYKRLAQMITGAKADTIHIGTEGPLGWAARKYCLRHGRKFSTFYHTQFPDYVAKRFAPRGGKAYDWWRKQGIRFVHKFHAPSSAIMTTTKSIEDQLNDWLFPAPKFRIPLSANLDLFTPGTSKTINMMRDIHHPVALYVGRIAVEKNLRAFLDMQWDGTKILVGDGPEREELEQEYKDARFLGRKTGEDLADIYRGADVFVFPSRTDTFGIVILEALASGTAVAGYNVTGPRDIITDPILGALDETDLGIAAKHAIKNGSAEERSRYVKTHYSWANSAKQFADMLASTL